ncbi:MAG TPA: trigger factor [Xanthobacteraceae bacterium]|jgi:trigger factor|nr:trigger factor [Xanthobacteraceae bacterium]
MQVTETLADGLKREFRVVVPAADLETRLNDRLVQIKDRVRLNGFRPGKVPVSHLKRVYGRSVMVEAIEEAVREANTKIVSDNGFKLAMDPKVSLPTAESEIEGIIAGRSDLSYTVALEVVPPITLADFKGIKLEKLVADVTDAEVDEALQKIADQNRPFSAKPEGAKVEQGDRVVINFTGRIDGQPFEGGTGEDIAVLVGSGGFIPGFEEQLVGMTAGETRLVKATFPKNYLSEALAGKEAEFDVTAKSIEAPGTVTIDDAFAKSLGMESLDKLRDAVKERIQREHTAASRQKLKRTLLDELDKLHKFAPPPTLVEEEFNNVWRTVTSDLQAQGRTFADEGTTEEAAKEEYRAIADRRVRLGLVLAEIGEKNNIKVTDDEVTRALVERARQFPGREQEIWDYYRKNPSALASLRAPIFEEKVIDFVVELAQVTEKPVSREELYKEEDESRAA